MFKGTKELLALLDRTELFRGQASALRDLEQKAEQNELTISVIGQLKRGKSSLVNAILGEDLLPVGIIPLTTVVTEIRYAPAFRAQVLLENGFVQEIPAAEIEEYCSEQKNSGNHKSAIEQGHAIGEFYAVPSFIFFF